MNVLSLFDGMSCARIAMQNIGWKADRYFASEIDKHTIKVTQTNFPDTVQLGDVRNIHITNDGIEVDRSHSSMDLYATVPDIIFAGSPCQGFSSAGKGLNFQDPRSALFFEFARILNEGRKVNPEIKFFLENVDMPQEWLNIISKYVGISPVKIDSALVCAQSRTRNYWTNFGTTVDMFGHETPGYFAAS